MHKYDKPKMSPMSGRIQNTKFFHLTICILFNLYLRVSNKSCSGYRYKSILSKLIHRMMVLGYRMVSEMIISKLIPNVNI